MSSSTFHRIRAASRAVLARRDRTWVVAPILASAAGLLAVAALLTGPVAANAASAQRYWVATTGTSGAANTSCAAAAYSTIQSAVSAAEAANASVAQVIEVCPGTYSEQVTITKSMSIVRALSARSGQVVIQLPASVGNSQTTGLSTTKCQVKDAATKTAAPQSVIEICGARSGGLNTRAVSVSISNVTVAGNWPNSACYDSLYDVLVEGGATLTMTGSIVEQAGAYPLNGCQGGVGIEAGFSPTGQIGHLILTNDTIQTYQKNGITVDGSGSTAKINAVAVSGAGPTTQTAQNGIQISFGATGAVNGSIVSGNNYTGAGEASATGILVVGGGGSVCGIGRNSPLVRDVSLTHNTLLNNDVGISLFNVNAACTSSVGIATRDLACFNAISNSHGYANGGSADANISGLVTKKYGAIGDQAGISDSGDKDVICGNVVSGIGYQSLGSTKALPNPKPPAWARPIDIFSFAPARHPVVSGNTYNGRKYTPK